MSSCSPFLETKVMHDLVTLEPVENTFLTQPLMTALLIAFENINFLLRMQQFAISTMNQD